MNPSPIAPTSKDDASYKTPTISIWRLLAYGFLGLPLAMCALPIYVQVPHYYSLKLGVALSQVGWILFLVRFIDALQDPVLGLVIDKLPPQKMTLWMSFSALALALGFVGLWYPLVSATYLPLWLGTFLVLAYVAHSMLNIAYLSWGARLAGNNFNQTDAQKITLNGSAWREYFGLCGVVIASVIPSLILNADAHDIASQMLLYSAGFSLILCAAIVALLRYAPQWQGLNTAHLAEAETQLIGINKTKNRVNRLFEIVRSMNNHPVFKALLLPYFLNALAVSVPATLVVFYINDRLQAASFSAGFLATYFVAAAFGLPVWVKLAKRLGVLACWRYSMMLAIGVFAFAGLLGAGDVVPFFVVCALSGLALGADLAFPPVLLAAVIEQVNTQKEEDVSNPKTAPLALFYGVWTLLAKFALALSGLSLPILALFNYHAGQVASPALAWAYAGVACVLKLAALIFLHRFSRYVLFK